MKKLTSYFSTLVMAIVLLLIASCTNKTAQTEEADVESMDSVTNVLEESNKELEEEVSKVEASLERIENELDTTK